VHRPPSVNLGTPNISETTAARKLKLKTIRYAKVLVLGIKNFQLGGIQMGAAPPNVNLGPPNIS